MVSFRCARSIRHVHCIRVRRPVDPVPELGHSAVRHLEIGVKVANLQNCLAYVLSKELGGPLREVVITDAEIPRAARRHRPSEAPSSSGQIQLFAREKHPPTCQDNRSAEPATSSRGIPRGLEVSLEKPPAGERSQLIGTPSDKRNHLEHR